MTPQQLCAKAADLIEARGLCKRTVFEGDSHAGPVCAIGGLIAANSHGDAFAEIPWSKPQRVAYRAALDLLASGLGVDIEEIGIWNDLPSTTAADVIARLRAVAQ